MIPCEHCGGTGRKPDEGLRRFLALTETRSAEELMMRALEPQLFDREHVDVMYELSPTSPAATPFLHVVEVESMEPNEWKIVATPTPTWEQCPSPEHPNARIPELHAPIRTGADVLRAGREAQEAERIERAAQRQDPAELKKKLEETGRGLGFM